MPAWIETLLGLIAQFTGGREPSGPSIVWYGIAAVAWGLLAYAAVEKRRRERSPREWLLLLAFLFGLGRELLMIGVDVLEAFSVIDQGDGHAFLLPAERALQNIAMVVIAAAFMGFVTNRRGPTKQYLKLALEVAALCYLASLWWWIGADSRDPQVSFEFAWSEWVSHVAMALLLFFPIGFLWLKSSGWTRIAVCAALGCFWMFEFLKILEMATGGVYASYFTPIRHGSYLLGIPLLGYVFLREALDELVRRRVALQARVCLKTIYGCRLWKAC